MVYLSDRSDFKAGRNYCAAPDSELAAWITPVRFGGPDRNGRVYSFSFGGVIETFLIGVGALTQAVWLSE
jgi:hypothetical protein